MHGGGWPNRSGGSNIERQVCSSAVDMAPPLDATNHHSSIAGAISSPQAPPLGPQALLPPPLPPSRRPHLGGGVLHLQQFEDGGAVIGDRHVANVVHQHLRGGGRASSKVAGME